MNQERIGRFIAELRKEKKLTQIDLANKLGITDRAISKWENGRGLPDLSLLTPLCEILDISINELLSGSRLDKKDYQEKLEENIINTIDYTDKKIKKTKKFFVIVLSVIVIMFIVLFMFYGIDITRMRNNKPVIFSTLGYSYAPAIDLKENEIELAITDYLIQKGDSEPKHNDNEKTFVSMRIYLIEEKEKDKHYNIYAWVLKEKHYLENDEIKQDSSSSIPYKFVVKGVDGKFSVTDSRIPRDGSDYSTDMKNIFPNSVRNDMDEVHTDGTIEKLEMDIQKQLNLYFHK